MKILYHHRTQGRGAEGVHIVSIVKALEEMGHEVTVLSPSGVDPMQHAGNAPVDKSNVKTSGMSKLWSFISKHMPGLLFELMEIAYNIPAARKLEKELRNNHYDLIYERYAFYLLAGAIKAKKHKIPFVLEANEVNGIKGRARKQYLRPVAIYMERRLFLLSRRIITVSSYLAGLINQRVEGEIFSGDVIVAPNAIDLARIPQKNKLPELMQLLNITSAQSVIGFAGWFDHWDRLDIFVRAIATARRQGYDAIGLLVGDGIGVDKAKALSAELGIEEYVVFTGAVQRKDIYNYLSLLDIALFPHSNEFGSPVVMFEFMSLKIPVVAPKLMPILDVLADEETARLFSILDEEDLSVCLLDLLGNEEKANQLAERAYELIINKHTWTKNASLITDVYKN